MRQCSNQAQKLKPFCSRTRVKLHSKANNTAKSMGKKRQHANLTTSMVYRWPFYYWRSYICECMLSVHTKCDAKMPVGPGSVLLTIIAFALVCQGWADKLEGERRRAKCRFCFILLRRAVAATTALKILTASSFFNGDFKNLTLCCQWRCSFAIVWDALKSGAERGSWPKFYGNEHTNSGWSCQTSACWKRLF